MDNVSALRNVETVVKSQQQQKSSLNNEQVADGIACHSHRNVNYLENGFKINIEIDAIGILLFFGAILTRFYRFGHPNNIV